MVINATLTQSAAANSRTTKSLERTRVLELQGNMGSLRWPEFDQNLSSKLSLDDLSNPAIIVDLSQVEYGGAELLRFLLKLRKMVGNRGGELVLSGVRDELAEVLCLTNLDRIFAYYPSVDEAREAIQSRRV